MATKHTLSESGLSNSSNKSSTTKSHSNQKHEKSTLKIKEIPNNSNAKYYPVK